jgi:hypothetical protein
MFTKYGVLLLLIAGCGPLTTATTGQVSYSLPLVPVTVALDSDCQLSVKIGQKIVTPIGVFEISVAEKLKPAPKKMNIIVDREDGHEAVYEVDAGSQIVFDPPVLVEHMHWKSPIQMVLRVSRCEPAKIASTPLPDAPAPPTPVPAPVVPQKKPLPATPPARQPQEQKPQKTVPIPDQAPVTIPLLTLAQFVKTFQPAEGQHFARIIHPVTGTEYQVSFSLPAGTPRVTTRKNRVEFRYPKLVVVFEFKKNGTLDVDYQRQR